MSRQPTEEEMEKYNLEAFIERKAKLYEVCELEYEVIRKDPEGAMKAGEELRNESHPSRLTGPLPTGPDKRKDLLDKCQKLVDRPATNPAEYAGIFALSSISSRLMQLRTGAT